MTYPNRRYATQDKIIRAIVARLQETISRYNAANCVVSDQPVPKLAPSGREICTVAPGPGQFEDVMFTGAGMMTVSEKTSIIVTPMIRHVRDRPGRTEEALLDPEEGLTVRKGEILGALLAEDWAPLGPSGEYLLESQLSPATAAAPGDVQVGEHRLVGLSIVFNTEFLWDIQKPGS